MSLKNFWQIIILSFHSSNLYITIVNKWQHWGLGFLLRFSVLVSIIASSLLFTLVGLTNFNNVSRYLNTMPELKINNNAEASLINPQIKLPLEIKSPDSNKDIIIVDLDITNAYKYQQNIIVFTKDRISFNFVGANDVSILYKDLLAGTDIKTLNQSSIIELLKSNQEKLLGTILILGVPVGSLLYFLLTLVKSMLYAFPASILAKILKRDLTFKQLTRLAVIVSAPAIIISAFLVLILLSIGINLNITRAIIDNIYLFYFVYAFFVVSSKRY
jgi:hypothetical protein